MLLLALLIISLAGCASSTEPSQPRTAPVFSLKLKRETVQRQKTHFVIDRKGRMQYAGGRDYTFGEMQEVRTLTPDELDAIWAIIENYKLNTATAKGGRYKTAKYEFTVSTSGLLGHSIDTIDDRVPGLTVLHDHLFTLQAETRFPDKDL